MKLKLVGMYRYGTKEFRQFTDVKGTNYIEKVTDINSYSTLRTISEIANESENLLGINAFYKNENDPKMFNYLVELIDGTTLEHIIAKEAKLSQEELDSIIYQVSSGLLNLHKNNIIHRDVKPQNIIVGRDNIVRLIDYDISRIYDENKAKDTTNSGTRGYAAPEQYGLVQTDPRSDIYSLGKTIESLIDACGRDYRYEYNEFISKACEIDKQNRYQSVEEIMTMIIRKQNRFFPAQLEQIDKARKLGLNEEEINILAMTKYNARQMGVIKHSINEKVPSDVLDLICDEIFNSQQMWQIKEGHLNGLSISQIKQYARPFYGPSQMAIYRLGLLQKKTQKEIFDNINGYNILVNKFQFDDEQLKKIRYGFYQGLNIDKIEVYAHEFLTAEQMTQIIEIIK